MNQTEQYLKELLVYEPQAIIQAFVHDIEKNTFKKLKRENIVPLVECVLNEEHETEDDLQGIPPTILIKFEQEGVSPGKLLILHINSKRRN